MKNTCSKTTTFRKKGKHITDSERQIIEKLYRKGVPIPQIAALLEVHRSTIYRELQRGRDSHLNSELITFSTYSADRASDERKLRASSHGPSLKIASDRMLVSQFNQLIINHKLSIYASRHVLINKDVDVKISLRTLYNYVHQYGFPILPQNLIHRPRKHAKKPVRKDSLTIMSWLKVWNTDLKTSMTVFRDGVSRDGHGCRPPWLLSCAACPHGTPNKN